MPDGAAHTSQHDYDRIAALIKALLDSTQERPSLSDLANRAGLSPHHLQRQFKRWAGVSPKQFLSFLTVEAAKERLARGASVLDAAYDTGLSGASRLHDHFVAVEAMTPGDYKSEGAGLTLRYGYTDTPFGEALVLLTERGLAGLTFVDGSRAAALEESKARWHLSDFVPDEAEARAAAQAIFSRIGPDRPLLLKGTNFQIQVWKALLAIPPDTAVTYAAVAQAAGSPTGARAAGTAIGENPIAFAIPCHRVLRATGLFTGYRWGAIRRHAITGFEAGNRHK